MDGLGWLPGLDYVSEAYATDADGEIVVGYSGSLQEERAFIWTQARGMQNLQDVLTDEFGLDLTGWTLTSASDMTPHDRVIVGDGINPNGETEAWIVYLGGWFHPESAAGGHLIEKRREDLLFQPRSARSSNTASP
jgi:hypothetical protein